MIGLIVMLAVALTVGLINGSLVRFGRFTPVAATLTTFIAVQGISQILRPIPGGTILPGITDAIETRVGPIPLAFVALVVAAALMEFALRRSRAGLSLRAVGSNTNAAHRIGVPVSDRRPGLRRRGVLRVPGWRDGDGPDCDRRFLAGHGVHPLERDGRRAWDDEPIRRAGSYSARSSVPR